MSVQQQIEAIISNRQQAQPEFLGYTEKVAQISDFISSVNKFKSDPGWISLLSDNEKLKKEWDSLVSNVGKLENLVRQLSDGESGLLIECLKRVKRDYLNIGCIGPWRQGKSTVISQLTGLSEYVIPRSQFFACTGTTINVFNGKQIVWADGKYVEKDGDKAVVHFHSFKSICKIINDYLSTLGFGSMPYANSKDTFVANCASCYKVVEGKPGTDSSLKEMLDKYLKYAPQYVDLLSTQEGMVKEITNLTSIESQKKLKPLVSYYEKTDSDYEAEGNSNPSQVFYVLAVKKVDVYTHFLINTPNGREEVGKLQFVDTPGIGEAKLEVAESLAKALRSDLDIAICLRKVSNEPGIDTSDSDVFHKVLKQNTAGRKPENWVFYLFNKIGDVKESILTSTFTAVNKNLATVPENGLTKGQVVGGISLRYDITNPKHNHVDFIDTVKEPDKLHFYFMSILEEMATTIADSDGAFYQETRDIYHEANQLYLSIISGSFRNVTKCTPTFDDREKILKTIEDISNMWNHEVDCSQTLNETINRALSNFYNEPYGVALAHVLGIPEEQIEAMSRDITEVLNKKELLAKERLERRNQIAEDLIFPFIQNIFNENVRSLLQVPTYFGKIKNTLADQMVNKALSLVETSNVVQQLDAIKLIIWRGMMNEGKLSFGKTDEIVWLDYFLSLLEEGGSDFSALSDSIKELKNYSSNLDKVIVTFIKTCINKVQIDNAILHGEGHSLEDIQRSVYKTLIKAESETKASVQLECKKVVESQMSFEANNFIGHLREAQQKLIPAHRYLLEYCNEFEQLIKFYNKYSTEIFTADAQALQKIAVQEWNILKLKYSI